MIAYKFEEVCSDWTASCRRCAQLTVAVARSDYSADEVSVAVQVPFGFLHTFAMGLVVFNYQVLFTSVLSMISRLTCVLF